MMTGPGEVETQKLVERMKEGLKDKIRDRSWKFKKYRMCFKLSDAVAWALQEISPDEEQAVAALNKMLDAGYVAHVVDPNKRIKVGEKNTLYFRFCERRSSSAMFRSIATSAKSDGDTAVLSNADLAKMKRQISRLSTALEIATNHRKTTQGNLELVHQAVMSLMTSMVTTAMLLLFVSFCVVAYVLPTSGVGIMSIPGVLCGILIALFVFQGIQLVSVWSLMDGSMVQTVTLTLDDDDTSRDGSTQSKRMSLARSLNDTFARSIKQLVAPVSTRSEPLIKMRDSSDLPEPSEWPHRPVLVCANTPAIPDLIVPKYQSGPCPIGVPFEFSSNLFEGRCLVRLKHIPSDDLAGDAEYFDGRSRLFQTIIQGQFKEPMKVSDVLTGHEFVRPLKHLPHPWILKMATNFIGKVAPGASIEVHTKQPVVSALLAGTSQVVRGDMPGNEPDITGRDIQEDVSVLGGKFESGKITSSRRKQILSHPKRASEYTFDTDTVYTFDFYQALFDAGSYALDLGVTKIGCTNVLDGQPIQSLGKCRDGRYLWSFQIWHENLLDVSPKKKQ